jgi:hypothetical protein
MRADVSVQIGIIAKRLGKARITAQLLKPGTPGGKHALGDRKPGIHVQRATIVQGEKGGGVGGSSRVDGISQEDLVVALGPFPLPLPCPSMCPSLLISIRERVSVPM